MAWPSGDCRPDHHRATPVDTQAGTQHYGRMPRWIVAMGSVALVGLLIAAAIWATRAESESEAVAATASAAAGAGGSSSPSSPPTPTPEPTPPIVLWAGDVCEARDVFLASILDVAANLEFDTSDPSSIGEQFQQQIPGQLGGVEAAAAELGTALGGVPLDYIEAAAALTTVNDRVTALNDAKDEALGHVDSARNAGNPVSAGVEWLQAAIAAKATYDAGIAVKDSLSELTDSADGDIKEAFDAAPQCQGLPLG